MIQLNSPGTAITVGVDDYAAGIALGTGDINDGPANGNYNLITLKLPTQVMFKVVVCDPMYSRIAPYFLSMQN